MIKAVVIHQPNFLPRLKVFIKIAISDIWVIYDDVQYVRREWQNRVYLRDSQQKEKLFTAPIKKTDFHDRINNVQLSNVTILNENLRKYFRYNYSQSPYYKWIEEYIEKLMIQTNNINNLSNYNIICTDIALDMLGLEVEELLSSKIEKLNIDRNKKLIEICNKSNSFNYICGSGGRTYIYEAEFNNSNINVIYYDYSKISKTDIYNLNTYQNYSFLDFIAYNGEDVLKSIIIEEKFKQIEKFKKGGFNCE